MIFDYGLLCYLLPCAGWIFHVMIISFCIKFRMNMGHKKLLLFFIESSW